MKNENVTAEAIKNVLWETLQGVKDKTIKPDVGNAISKLANGIISTAKLEFEAAKFAGLQSQGLNTFLEAKGEKPIDDNPPKPEGFDWMDFIEENNLERSIYNRKNKQETEE